MNKNDVKDAKFTWKLRANSGYSSSGDCQISANQYGDICRVLEGHFPDTIPADDMQALRELIEEAVSKGFDIGLRYQGCLENNAADADIAIEVDRILAEKGKV
jgi:hypothetical protein